MNSPLLLHKFIHDCCSIISDEKVTDIKRTTADDLPLQCPLNMVQFLRFVSMTFPSLLNDAVIETLIVYYGNPRLSLESQIGILQILGLANCQNQKEFLRKIIDDPDSILMPVLQAVPREGANPLVNDVKIVMAPQDEGTPNYHLTRRFVAIQALEVLEGKRELAESKLWHESFKGVREQITWMTRTRFPVNTVLPK
jgi:hypothetical protein